MNTHRSNSLGQRGFSLIELMVAILVGIILLGGMVQIFIMSRTSYRVQTSLNYMQENLRFAANQLNYSVRMSGYLHTIPDASSGAVLVTLTTPPPCGLSTWLAGMQGFDGAAAGSLPAGLTCLDVTNYMPNTDVLSVTYSQPEFVYPPSVIAAVRATSPVTSAAIVPRAIYAIVYDKVYNLRGRVEKAVIGTGATIAPLAAMDAGLLASQNTQIARDYVTSHGSPLLRGAGMFPLAIDLYYVRRCSRLNVVGGTCDSTSDGGDPQPTLVRATLSATGDLVEQPIVESIEQMQVEYLASGCPDFMSASRLTAANWATANCIGTPPANIWGRVIDVRIVLLARSSVLEVGYTDTTPYRLSNDTTAYLASSAMVPTGAPILPRNSSYRRKLMSVTVLPRNAVRPLPR